MKTKRIAKRISTSSNTNANKGGLMKDLMAKLEIKVADVAEAAGYSKSTIYKVLKGEASEKAMEAVQVYLEEMAYWAGENKEVSYSTELTDVEFKTTEQYIEDWYTANKECLEPVVTATSDEDKFFYKNASVIKAGIYNVVDKGGRRKPKAVMSDNYVSDVKYGYADATDDKWAFDSYTDSKGNKVNRYDDGGLSGVVAKRSASEISFGNAVDSALNGRSSVYEDGFDSRVIRITDHGSNFIKIGSYGQWLSYELKEEALIKELMKPTKRELNRKSRKEMAVKMIQDTIAKIIACNNYKTIKEDLINGAYSRVANALQKEFGTSYVGDHCYFITDDAVEGRELLEDIKELKLEIASIKRSMTQCETDRMFLFCLGELQELEAELNDNQEELKQYMTTANSKFWTIARKAMWNAVDKSAWKQGQAKKNSKWLTKEEWLAKKNKESYERVQSALNRIPSDNSEHLASLIRDGIAAKFGLDARSASQATWYAYQQYEARQECLQAELDGREPELKVVIDDNCKGFSTPVRNALINWSKAEKAKKAA